MNERTKQIIVLTFIPIVFGLLFFIWFTWDVIFEMWQLTVGVLLVLMIWIAITGFFLAKGLRQEMNTIENPKPVTREEALELVCLKPTDPDSLKWEPLISTIRLRMFYTEENASEELIETIRTFNYPDNDIPEIIGLKRVFNKACEKSNLNGEIVAGSNKFQTGTIGFFEPLKFNLPFKKASLELIIAPAEFQWILKKHKKEQGQLSLKMDTFKDALLSETRQWLINGNR